MSKKVLIENYLSNSDNEIAFSFLYTAFKVRYLRLETLISISTLFIKIYRKTTKFTSRKGI